MHLPVKGSRIGYAEFSSQEKQYDVFEEHVLQLTLQLVLYLHSLVGESCRFPYEQAAKHRYI